MFVPSYSCLLAELSFICRLFLPNHQDIQTYLTVLIVLGTWPYFLFFCRGVKILGPFVLMICRVIVGDLVKFGFIYSLFVIGFSQAFYIIFHSHGTSNSQEKNNTKCNHMNPLESISESIMNMVLMSLNDFDRLTCHFDRTSHSSLSYMMFILYMPISAIMLINLLIAMIGKLSELYFTPNRFFVYPGKAYRYITLSRGEWVRQWARVVLLVERGVRPSVRRRAAERWV